MGIAYKIFHHRKGKRHSVVYDIKLRRIHESVNLCSHNRFVIDTDAISISGPLNSKAAIGMSVPYALMKNEDVFEVHWTEGDVKGSNLLRFIQSGMASTLVPIQG